MQPPQDQAWIEYQQKQDEEHLRLLVLFSKINAGLMLLCSCFSLPHLIMGFGIMTGGIPMDKGMRSGEAQFMGTIFVLAGAGYMAVMITLAVLNWMASNRFEKRYGHTFLIVVAAINCLHMPIGTAIGVFSLIVLSRPSAKQLFDANARPTPPTAEA